jgi:DNA-binding NarL/FixJ family response regulator
VSAEAARVPLGQSPGSIGVAVVGTDPGDREVLCGILGASGELHSCGFFMTAEEALRSVPTSEVRIALVALALPDLCGIRCALELAWRRPGLKTVLIASAADSALLGRAIAAGVDQCLISPFKRAACLEIVRLALAASGPPPNSAVHQSAHPSIHSSIGPITHESNHPQGVFPLTADEDQIMACLAQGLLYKEIVDRLNFSLAKVKRLQHSAFDKLGEHKVVRAVEAWHQRKQQR